MIIVDSREKKNQHILSWFDSHKIDYIVQKLEIADYKFSKNDKILVDRKQNLAELLCNLLTTDKRRFYNEMRNAHAENVKVIVLCEHGNGINQLSDVAKWQSKYSKLTGRKLLDEMYKLHVSYAVDFEFCNKSETAEKIIQILRW